MKTKGLIIIIVLSFMMVFPIGHFLAQNMDNYMEYSLYQNNPNPFDETTTVKFSRQENCYVKLYVTERQTGKISMLAEGEMIPGEHGIIFKASGKSGSGSENHANYICTMEAYSLPGNILIYTSEIKMTQR